MENASTFAHSHVSETSVEEYRDQVRRVVQSATFRNAATLQLLLQFLTDKTIGGSAESLKEYTIGVEALGRKPDFDPKVDPIVRVQSHRLRVKLKEYYDDEGSRDPILIQFPKGHYVPTFEVMAVSLSHRGDLSTGKSGSIADTDSLETAPIDAAAGTKSVSRTKLRWSTIGELLALATLMMSFGYWLAIHQIAMKLHTGEANALNTGPVDDGLVEAFWRRFLGNDTSPVIAYPDAVFLLDDSNDLFRFRHGAIDSRGALVDPHVARQFASNPEIVAKAGQLYYENGYTGTGELESVAMLASLFGHMGLKPIIKSSRDVGPNDLNQHNVILLGSSFQNPAVEQLLTAGDFSYSNPDQHHEQWRAQILNAHPRDGEASSYHTERDANTKALTADFGIVTIAPGVTPGRSIAIIGGLDTKGTEGAAMFVTSKYGIERLSKALSDPGDKGKKDLTPFQALVHVRLAKGYQVLGADLISVHRVQAANMGNPQMPPRAN
ncbi:hypothetical protein [Edaphobacter albus]|uniref:hypothetical protein n=1 Tax=Edaphobacter sp. 4G125 TaxID=2763071 RepID=UPI001647CDEE|nr:hypothetical protein [Edaphobacter sp. 4G125]QNI38193.1 hypothetical protein H7846_08110 [Edaphobacter sp. 4G125]